MNSRVKGKVALITGRAGDIISACAAVLSRDGVRVITTTDLEQGADERAPGPFESAINFTMDAASISRDPSWYDSVVDRCVHLCGSLDILVNCGETCEETPLLNITPDLWWHVMSVNLHEPFLYSQAFARSVIQRRTSGVIVNLSSIHSTRPRAGLTPLSVSTGAIDGLTRSLAVEWAKYGIRVNAVAPTYTHHGAVSYSVTDPAIQALVDRTPLKRLIEPADIAAAVLFLCSENTRFLTGQTIYLDGGYTANGSW